MHACFREHLSSSCWYVFLPVVDIYSLYLFIILLLGNVYVKYENEEQAKTCVDNISGRVYSGTLLKPELSPVTDFREARCRQYEKGMIILAIYGFIIFVVF